MVSIPYLSSPNHHRRRPPRQSPPARAAENGGWLRCPSVERALENQKQKRLFLRIHPKVHLNPRSPDTCIVEKTLTSPPASRTSSTSFTYVFRFTKSGHLLEGEKQKRKMRFQSPFTHLLLIMTLRPTTASLGLDSHHHHINRPPSYYNFDSSGSPPTLSCKY